MAMMNRPKWFESILLCSVLALCSVPLATSWDEEGHTLTCRIAQKLLEPGPAQMVEKLLPECVKGDLSALCSWPDEIRHSSKYHWTSSLQFIDTPDGACTYSYSRDCHDLHGVKDMCITGAIKNFTIQLLHYSKGTSDHGHNMTEALLFLSHFLGDIHQPMHVGFTSDARGNFLKLHWFGHESNLHHVWDSDIIVTALKDYYDENLDLLQKDLEKNITTGLWHDDVAFWTKCSNLLSCPHKYARESVKLACEWGYKGVTAGDTLSVTCLSFAATNVYFDSRMPIVMKRITQEGVRLAMFLNHIFTDAQAKIAVT